VTDFEAITGRNRIANAYFGFNHSERGGRIYTDPRVSGSSPLLLSGNHLVASRTVLFFLFKLDYLLPAFWASNIRIAFFYFFYFHCAGSGSLVLLDILRQR
jgi:hypothetical protein